MRHNLFEGLANTTEVTVGHAEPHSGLAVRGAAAPEIAGVLRRRHCDPLGVHWSGHGLVFLPDGDREGREVVETGALPFQLQDPAQRPARLPRAFERIGDLEAVLGNRDVRLPLTSPAAATDRPLRRPPRALAAAALLDTAMAVKT
jgi:hypothetical protein